MFPPDWLIAAHFRDFGPYAFLRPLCPICKEGYSRMVSLARHFAGEHTAAFVYEAGYTVE